MNENMQCWSCKPKGKQKTANSLKGHCDAIRRESCSSPALFSEYLVVVLLVLCPLSGFHDRRESKHWYNIKILDLLICHTCKIITQRLDFRLSSSPSSAPPADAISLPFSSDCDMLLEKKQPTGAVFSFRILHVQGRN